jgi:outer membrane protein OmpA-like peptidoglycan-associated protein
MKLKYTLLIFSIIICSAVSAQVTSNVDSLLEKYDSVSVIPDTLLTKIDTSKKTLIGQTKSVDTAVTKTSDTSQKAEQKPVVKKLDRRWFISPLKVQAQEFGMLEQQRMGGTSNAYLLPFRARTNRSVAASVYKNFTKNISMSVDLGMSKGHITTKDVRISTTRKNTYYLGNATLYYHLLGGQYKLQPFVAAGVNNLFQKEHFTSAPVGAGVKFTSKKIMIEGQGAYGYAISKNIANTLMYSLGIYIPLKSKKEKKREAEEKAKKDSAAINITNITNNYYLLSNLDSLKKAKEDSIKNETEKQLKQKTQSGDDGTNLEELDPDDPMRLPAAQKYIIYFYYDQYALTSSAFSTIDQVVQRLRENKNLGVHLKGHTDMSGSEQYNSPLSKKRAQMVFDYMNSRGIGVDRMIISSYGKKYPAVKNEDPNTAWMNRRCEIVIYEKR